MAREPAHGEALQQAIVRLGNSDDFKLVLQNIRDTHRNHYRNAIKGGPTVDRSVELGAMAALEALYTRISNGGTLV